MSNYSNNGKKLNNLFMINNLEDKTIKLIYIVYIVFIGYVYINDSGIDMILLSSLFTFLFSYTLKNIFKFNKENKDFLLKYKVLYKKFRKKYKYVKGSTRYLSEDFNIPLHISAMVSAFFVINIYIFVMNHNFSDSYINYILLCITFLFVLESYLFKDMKNTIERMCEDNNVVIQVIGNVTFYFFSKLEVIHKLFLALLLYILDLSINILLLILGLFIPIGIFLLMTDNFGVFFDNLILGILHLDLALIFLVSFIISLIPLKYMFSHKSKSRDEEIVIDYEYTNEIDKILDDSHSTDSIISQIRNIEFIKKLYIYLIPFLLLFGFSYFTSGDFQITSFLVQPNLEYLDIFKWFNYAEYIEWGAGTNFFKNLFFFILSNIFQYILANIFIFIGGVIGIVIFSFLNIFIFIFINLVMFVNIMLFVFVLFLFLFPLFSSSMISIKHNNSIENFIYIYFYVTCIVILLLLSLF